MTTLEKRLIALSAHGIWIEYADGHRWVRCADDENCTGQTFNGFHFDTELKDLRIQFNGKIYGGLMEALNLIDNALVSIKGYNLETWYNDVIDEPDDIFRKSSDNGISRIDYDNPNGGLF